jgi:hypothetical protein
MQLAPRAFPVVLYRKQLCHSGCSIWLFYKKDAYKPFIRLCYASPTNGKFLGRKALVANVGKVF